MPMHIDFYFDPICPWCWITSRWLLDVQEHRDLEVTWRPFSLFVKNDKQPGDRGYDRYLGTHRALRVVEAVRERLGDGPIEALYTELGRRIHHDRERPLDFVAALAAEGLDAEFLAAADDDAWDDAIARSMKDALAVAGEDVGVPLLVFPNDQGFFGPVMSPAPVGEAAAEMFDHIAALASYECFWELKRDRQSSPEFGPRP